MDYEIESYEIWVKEKSEFIYELRDEVGTEEDAVKYHNKHIDKGLDCMVYKVEKMVFPND